MGWCSLILVSVVLLHIGTLKPNPLDELTVNLNLDDAPNGGHTLESPEIESEEWKTGKTKSKDSSCTKKRNRKQGEKRKRILGGEEYIPGAKEGVPDYENWMASIKITTKVGDGLCGGTLISEKHVLTALHCIFDRNAEKFHKTSKVKVYFDRNKLEIFGGIEFKAAKYYFVEGKNKMPEYMLNTKENPKVLRDDIAVIKLHKAIKSTSNLRPLPISVLSGPELFTKGLCEFWHAGWGMNELPNKTPQVLHYTNKLFYFHCHPDEKIRQDTMMCFASDEVASCNGDSGGPVVIPVNENSWALQSIYSWSPTNCSDPQPYKISVTIDVYQYRDRIEKWIKKKI